MTSKIIFTKMHLNLLETACKIDILFDVVNSFRLVKLLNANGFNLYH